MKENRINLLIDADSLYFKISCVTKKEHQIRKAIKLKLREIENACSFFFEEVVFNIAVKGQGNYRESIYDEYKGQRPDLDPDLKKALNYAHNHLVKEHGAVQAHGMEADDLVGIWTYECMANGENYVVIHIDKDLNMLPGPHYNFDKGDLYETDLDGGFRYFMHQCLTGDRADNIKGIKGIGPKKADKILEGVPPDRMWSVVKQAWREHGIPTVNMIQSMRLLWMSANKQDVATANLNVLDRLEGDYEDFYDIEDLHLQFKGVIDHEQET